MGTWCAFPGPGGPQLSIFQLHQVSGQNRHCGRVAREGVEIRSIGLIKKKKSGSIWVWVESKQSIA